MTNNQLTKEWLQQTIAELESVRDEIPFGIDTNSELELAAFKLALAAMDSEPVAYAWVSRSGKKHLTRCEPEQWRDAVIVTPLYRHAQQPVVPRVTCWSCRNQVEISAIGGCDGYCPECDAPIDLGEEPYTSEQPVPVVPDIDELRLAFEAAERESGDGFNLHKYGIGYADDKTQGRWDTWLACRAAMFQAGNSPVIPDTWIPVSERLPERGDYLVTDGCDFDVQLFNGEEFIPGFVWEDKITHWMPLPAVPPAPTQENI